MLGRLDARTLIAPLCLREIGLVILVEPLEKWVIGILQLVNGLTALRVAYDGRIPMNTRRITLATFVSTAGTGFS